MKEIQVVNHEGIFVTDSREVAEMTGIRHDNLTSKIKGYVEVLTTSNLRALDFFIESTYTDGKGEERPCYLLTRKGCDMVANKMTGKKGVLFTAEYVTAFEKMEKQIQELPKLSKELQAIFVIDGKQQQLETKINDLENSMPLFNIECKELQSVVRKVGIQTLGGKDAPAYKDNSLRGKVYSDIQSQLRREFGVDKYEAIKHSQIEAAKEIVQEYRAPQVLLNSIMTVNNQVSIGTSL